jgi:hypothetical protein
MTNVGSIASTDNDFVLEHGQQQNGYNHEYFSDISRKLAAFSISSKSTNNKVAQRDLSPTAYSSLLQNGRKKRSRTRLSYDSLDKDVIPNGIATPPSDQSWEGPLVHDDDTHIYRASGRKEGSLLRSLCNRFKLPRHLARQDGRAWKQEKEGKQVSERVSHFRNGKLVNSFKHLVLCWIFPALACSSILFYVLHNLTLSKLFFLESTSPDNLSKSSFSWWILFLLCRHPAIWFLAG